MAVNTQGSPRFQPLGVYRGLDAGPGWGRDSVEAQSQAIDGTKQRLRDSQLGSPFTFRVAPPSILLEALLGNGGAQTRDFFDPLLRQVYDDAEKTFQATQEAFESGAATLADVEAARQGMLGGRPPNSGQNIDIIEAATRSKSNFSSVVDRREQFRQSNFFATGPTRGTTLTLLEDMIASNGIRFNPSKVSTSQANQSAVADLIQALDVIVQLNRVIATPALTLLINPEQLQINYAKKQSYQDRNRYNYIFQSWGEEQVRLSVSGRSAGFVAGSGGNPRLQRATRNNQSVVTGQLTESVSGYQYASKWDSAAWQNLMALFTFYRNNGYIYDTAGRPRSEAHLFIGNIEIAYDQWVYVGNFENFSYEYDENKQHGAVAFSFEFTASAIYDRAQDGPVRPLFSPTPSPSSSPRGVVPRLPNPQARTTSFSGGPAGAENSTAVLDPVLDGPGTPRFAGSNRGTGATTINPFAPNTIDPFAPSGR
jgi:hypothetical protein